MMNNFSDASLHYFRLVPIFIINLVKYNVHTEQDVAVKKNPSTHADKKHRHLLRMNNDDDIASKYDLKTQEDFRKMALKIFSE